MKAQTASAQVGVIRRYLLKRYNSLQLTTKQAFDELCLDKGRELNKLLHTSKLNSLGVTDIARYIVLHT